MWVTAAGGAVPPAFDNLFGQSGNTLKFLTLPQGRPYAPYLPFEKKKPDTRMGVWFPVRRKGLVCVFAREWAKMEVSCPSSRA